MLADEVKFSDVCVLLSKLRDTKGATASAMRKKLFEKFIASCTEKCTDAEDVDEAMYSIIRLVLSTLDPRTLNIKEKKLVDQVCRAMALSPGDIQGVNVSNPTRVCEVLANEVSSRIAPEDFEHLSIAEINKKLDSMSAGSASIELYFLFKNCSRDELFWLFNIMIKNVESTIGVATNVILSWLGSQAAARWNAARDLHAVVSTASDGEPVLGANFRPMLLARLPKEGWWEVLKENCGEEFFVETKYDGEHVLMHKISCDNYKWYTRNGKDFTKDYGSSSSETDLLSGRIHPLFRSSVNDCILDCELMLWDKKLKKLCRRQFKSQNSEHRSHSFRHLDPSDNVQLVVIVFDLLYLNGKSIMNAPLYQRLRALDTAVLKDNQRIDTISIAPRATISTKEEVETLFQKALSAGEEGIVVKRKDVVYQPGTRMTKNGWFKLKAYLSDNEIDLALVAIMPEKGKDGQVAYQLAVRDGDIFRTITTCSAGLSLIDRDYIYNLSSKSDGPLLKEAPPELHGWDITDAKGGFIRKEHWLVVETTAAGIRDGKFIDPVMRRIRYDKDVEEVDTMATFREYEQVLANSKLSNKSPTKQRPRKLTKRMIAEASAVPEVDVKCVRRDSPLVGETVCVLYGTDERLRKRLMGILKTYGANVVANPAENMSIVIATTEKHPKTKTQVEAGKATVLKATWVLRCEEQGAVVPWTPDEVINEVEGGFSITE